MSRQQAVQQYVNSSSSASCSALRQTGCCTAVCVTAAEIFHPTFKMCLKGNTVYRPGVSKRPLQRGLSYSNECFLKNEAACTHAFQKYAPRKFLLVLVMKREEDSPPAAGAPAPTPRGRRDGPPPPEGGAGV